MPTYPTFGNAAVKFVAGTISLAMYSPLLFIGLVIFDQ